MLTKGAIGNLVNRYRAVLQKCNLINTFGSLAVASMLMLGGAAVAGAAEVTTTINATDITATDNLTVTVSNNKGINAIGYDAGNASVNLSGDLNVSSSDNGIHAAIAQENKSISLTLKANNMSINSTSGHGLYVQSGAEAKCYASTFNFETAGNMTIGTENSAKRAIFVDDGAYKTTTNITAGGTLTTNGYIFK